MSTEDYMDTTAVVSSNPFMTVGEVLERLKGFDPSRPVVIYITNDVDDGVATSFQITGCTLRNKHDGRDVRAVAIAPGE